MPLPFFGGRKEPRDEESDPKALQEQVVRLKMKVQQLEEQVHAKEVVLGEYLYKQRSMALPLMGSEHEMRYFMLRGPSLKCYKSAKDVKYDRNEETIVLGCIVAWEGQLSTGNWAFSILDPSGTTLLCLSSPKMDTAQQWLQALQEAGCTRDDELASANKKPTRKYSNAFAMLVAPISSLFGWPMPESPTASGSMERKKSPFTDLPSQPEAEADDSASESDAGSSPKPQAVIHPARRGPMRGSTPVHTGPRFSFLSSERIFSQDFSGFVRLGQIILVVTNFRLALENALKYGIRMNPMRFVNEVVGGHGNKLLLSSYLVLALCALMSLLSEKVAHILLLEEDKYRLSLAKKDKNEKEIAQLMRKRVARNEMTVFALNFLSTTLAVIVPWAVITYTKAEPLGGGILFMLCVTYWMKLVSYHHCCCDLRTARRTEEVFSGERGSPDTDADWGLLQYPENLTLKNLAYFLAAPTLCYQVNYPRTRGIRYKWLMRRVGELILGLTVLSVLITQYIEPTVINALEPLKQMEFGRIMERILKLSIPCLYAWLDIFYVFFHVWFNILAELLCFADREFYKDWWNAPTLGDYWKLWNMPVHKWLLRHVHYPLMRRGLNKYAAVLVVFFVSAVFHEIVLGVPLHMVRLWAFSGILFQVPLIWFTEFLRKKLGNRGEWGNIIFWITFCVVGQPVSVLLYYHDYVVQQAALSKI